MRLAPRLRKESSRAAESRCCARPLALNSLKLEGDEQTGVKIIKRACEEPIRQITGNAGYEGAVLIEKILAQQGPQLRLQCRDRRV